jgi:predicted aldo/keto reductase-like oxidoreductase
MSSGGMNMKYEQFGSTGHQVSSLGFGAMNLPGVPLEQAKQALNYALDYGINYIDTAAAYKNSEEIIGESISHRRQEYFLATKTGERSYEKAKAEIERSLVRMRTDHLDLIQIHYVNYVEEYKTIMGEKGAYEAVLEAKKEGKVRFIGITGHRPDLLTRWISKGQFDQVLFHLSLVQPFALQELIPMAMKQGMGRTAMKPLSGGFVQPVDKAIRYPYAQDVNTIISGMISVDQVKENIRTMDIQVSDEEKAGLEQLASELGSHNCRRCNYCSCPLEISIPDVMISSVVREKFGLLPKGQQWFEKHREKITACSDYEPCKEKPLCEDKCPYHLPMQRTVQEAAHFYN